MAIIKCKMCGGDIVLAEDKTYGTCEYCGSTMTFPKVSDEQRLNLFNRANHFRRQNEFDKAIAAYDKILDQDDTDAEAHWGAVLSRYGIEYVEDPVTHERIPTCHRVQLGSILTDADYLAALEHAPDTRSRDIYESEAKRIADIQKGILAISAQEKPYDVFICYKETDDSGSRTKDSTLAQDIYYQLTNEGYKVFFSRITLEDKLGQQYEPYIFAALNSAKVMLVIGTKAEYFNAVWVKNEWSRYLDLMKRDRNKLLIPCYRDMDPYDLPEELSALQSQDMSKIGFMQDIIRGVKKVLNAGKEEKPAVVAVPTAGPGVASLHKRAVLFLEDGDWDSASEYFDRILDIDPEYAPAYIGKVQVTNKVRKENGLARCAQPLKGNPDYQKALRFASEQQKAIYEGYNRAIEDRLERERKEAIYREADALEKRAATETEFITAAKKYDDAGEIRDAKERAANCRAKAASAKQAAERQAEEYRKQLEREREERKRQEEEARKEAERKAEQERIEAEKRAEQERIEAEKRARQERIEAEKRRKRNRIVAAAVAAILVVTGAAFVVNNKVIQPKNRYNAAQALLEEGKYDEAAEAFTAMEGYSDSADKVREAHYTKAMSLLNAGKLDKALESFKEAGDYSDTAQQIKNIEDYTIAEKHYKDSDYIAARPIYATLGDYLDSAAKLDEINKALYAEADQKEKAGNLGGAYETWAVISDYSDCSEKMATVESNYQAALAKWENGDKTGAEMDLVALAGWSDADAKLETLREEIADDAVTAEDYDTALAYYAKLKDQTAAVTTKITAATQAKNYQEAVSALDSKNLKTAYAKFVAAGDYSDAAVRAAQLDKYIKANEAMTTGAYSEARAAYLELDDYLDSQKHLETCNKALYDGATTQMENGDIAGAYETFTLISGYEDSAEKVEKVDSDYQAATKLMEDGDFDNASVAFVALKNYSDSRTQAFECFYRKAELMVTEGEYAEAASLFIKLGDYSDSAERAKEAQYKNAGALWSNGDLQEAAEEFKNLGDYSDAMQQLQTISTEIAEKAMKERDYVSALAAYLRLDQTEEIKAKEYELAQFCYEEGGYAAATSAYEALGQYELSMSKLPIARYAWADQLFGEGSYAEAAEQFALLGDMTDSTTRAQESLYQLAREQMERKDYDTAKTTFQSISGYSDADTLTLECDYRKAMGLLNTDNYKEAQTIFESLGEYSDSATKADECVWLRAEVLLAEEKYEEAQELYAAIDYYDSSEKAELCVYKQAMILFNSKDYTAAETLLITIDGYEDSADRIKDCRLQQGYVLMKDENYVQALEFFTALDYKDSENCAAECHYALGQKANREGRVDDAVKEYVQATTLSEARNALMSTAKDYAATNEMEKAIQALWVIREDEAALTMLRDIGDLKLASGEMGTAILAYCAMGDIKMPELQALISMETQSEMQIVLEECNLLPEQQQFSKFENYTLASAAMMAEVFDCAIKGFELVGEYEDAPTLVMENKYQKGISLLKSQAYDDALALFDTISEYSDAVVQVKECKYEKAAALVDSGAYIDAYNLYIEIRDYKDVDAIIKDTPNLAAIEIQEDEFKVGNVVKFGDYHGSLSWIVLKRDGDRALLLTQYIIDYQPKDGIDAWLRDHFSKEAFTSNEQEAIGEEGVFILTQMQARTLLSQKQRITTSTQYAEAVYDSFDWHGWTRNSWWVHTDEIESYNHKEKGYHVDSEGKADNSTTGINVELGIRPAVWASIHDDVFWPFTDDIPSEQDSHSYADNSSQEEFNQNTEGAEQKTEKNNSTKLVNGWYLSEDEMYAVQPSDPEKKSDGVYTLTFKVRNQSTGKTIYDKEIEIKAAGELTLASENAIQDFTTGEEGKYRFTIVCEKKEGNTVKRITKKISFKAK